jgi:predicted  nucleic acid-binding Zn-ribbon protein
VIQAAMYFALGLLTAGLLALLLMPAIWRRAARLTRARVEAAMPMTLAEIEADKDQLRANFAVANRRLEMEAGTLKDKLAEETVAVGRGRDEVSALTRAKAALGNTVATLEERVAELGGALSTTENKLATANAEIVARDERLAAQTAHLAELQAQFDASQVMTEEQRLELVARATEIGNVTDSLVGMIASNAATAATRDRLTAELALERDRLVAEQKRADGLAAGLAALQAERMGRIADLERNAGDLKALDAAIVAERARSATLAQEIATLKALEKEIAEEHAPRARLASEIEGIKAERAALAGELAARGGQIAELNARVQAETARQEDLTARLQASAATLDAAQRATAALGERHQADAMAEGDNFRKAMAATESEKASMALRVAALEDDYAALRTENTELRRVAGAEWESEREENRRLRERLNEIAMGVVRLTQSLDSGTPAPTPHNDPAEATPSVAVTEPDESGTTLADRLRAVQRARTRH